MIDFHCHIIPGVDDGAKSMEIAVAMAKMSQEEGVKYICATPHFIPGEFEITKAEYEERLTELRRTLDKQDIDISILSGLEVYIHPELPRLFKDSKIWTINNSQYMLIELPMEHFPIYTEEVFYELMLLGITPILAHPERNLKIIEKPSLLEGLIEQGVLMQVNAGSLVGKYGKRIKGMAEYLVSRNMIHILGSDGHNDNSRAPHITAAYKKLEQSNKRKFEWMVKNQYNIMQGLPIEAFEEVIQAKGNKKKGFFLFDLLKRNRRR